MSRIMSSGSVAVSGISNRAGTNELPGRLRRPRGPDVDRHAHPQGVDVDAVVGGGTAAGRGASPVTKVSLSVPPIRLPAFLARSSGRVMVSRWFDSERPVISGDIGALTGLRTRATEPTSSDDAS